MDAISAVDRRTSVPAAPRSPTDDILFYIQSCELLGLIAKGT
jgi:hypothetical protein